jgi:hypothetical protein
MALRSVPVPAGYSTLHAYPADLRYETARSLLPMGSTVLPSREALTGAKPFP